jgi:hypothetical protein
VEVAAPEKKESVEAVDLEKIKGRLHQLPFRREKNASDCDRAKIISIA